MKFSLVLDRREFLLGVLTTAAWRISFSVDGATSPVTTDWAVDHIFGPYPPYAHPIPYGRQPIDPGVIDPYLLI
jgi:hypothetical protein